MARRTSPGSTASPPPGRNAAYTDHGLVLFGGATLPEARSRGAYRALVGARWQDAVARGRNAEGVRTVRRGGAAGDRSLDLSGDGSRRP